MALLTLGVVILILYATPSVVEGTARVEASYRHLGVSDHIARTGQLDRGLDAYFNWPGFFAMLGTLQRASGAPDLLALARWAPTMAAFAYLAPGCWWPAPCPPRRGSRGSAPGCSRW